MKYTEQPLNSPENVDTRHKINYIVAYELYNNAAVFVSEPALERWHQLFETDASELNQRYQIARTVIDALDSPDRESLLTRALTFGQD